MNIEDMPLNQTKTLAERLSEGRMPVGEALKCAMQLADSLRKLHDQGKAHGAITPSNVVLAADGVELLPAAQGSAATVTPYTAPEVVQGHTADERSDIFSLGAVMFEMLTGRRAFDGESRVTLAPRAHAKPQEGVEVVKRGVPPRRHGVARRAQARCRRRYRRRPGGDAATGGTAGGALAGSGEIRF